MSRLKPIIIILMAVACGECAGQTHEMLKISLFAPKQHNAPVHIVAFQYKKSNSVQAVLSNESTKVVVAVSIEVIVSSPLECAGGENASTGVITGVSLKPLRLTPHQIRATDPEDPGIDITGLVGSARDLKTLYALAQAGISEVDFDDGTKWRPCDPKSETSTDTSRKIDTTYGCPDVTLFTSAPFSKAIIKSDSQFCASAWSSSQLDSLAQATGTGFSSTAKPVQISTKKIGSAASIPHLTFECSLDNSVATCPTPNR